MLAYVCAVKRAFRDQHGFVPTGGSENDPNFDNIAEGIYECEIQGAKDFVVVLPGGGLSFLNKTRAEAEAKLPQRF